MISILIKSNKCQKRILKNLQKLEKLVTANYFVTLQNCLRKTEVEVLQILNSSVKIDGISFQNRDKDDVLIAFNVGQDNSLSTSRFLRFIIGLSMNHCAKYILHS